MTARPVEVAAIVAGLSTRTFDARSQIEQWYRDLPNVTAFWALIDLVGSTAYRASLGHEAGYIRGETFLTLAKTVTERPRTATVIKEIGDAVLFRADDFRDALEPTLLVDAVSRFISMRSDKAEEAFAVRAAITHGPAKQLQRSGVLDYLGSAIDRLARLASVRDDTATILLDEDACRQGDETIREYPFLTLGSITTLPSVQARGFSSPVRYRGLRVDSNGLMSYRDFFSPWR